jgi:hypothetical protein
MDRQYIRDNQVIERYLRGKLSAAEEQAFEEAYLADSELFNELVLTERLRDGIKGAAPPQAVTPARRRSFFGTPQYAVAASVVAALALLSSGVLLVENRTLESAGTGSAALAARLEPLVAVRGAGDNTIAAPAAAELVVLLLDPGFAEYDVYDARLVRGAGGDATEIVRRQDLTPTYEGLIALAVPGALLASGTYEVELYGRGSDWPAARAPDTLTRTALTVAP